MKSGWQILIGIAGGLLGAGVIFWITRQPRGESVILRPPPSPLPVTVYVAGAVVKPGVFQLSAGSRVKDAVDAAGGLLPEANDQAVNLAARLEDGQRVHIPSLQTEVEESIITPANRTTEIDLAPSISTEGSLVNINTASKEELESLPVIGPVIAQRILDYRETNGLFLTIEDLMNVAGIGEKNFEKIKFLITVEGP
jgi:competence protein ComEA